MKATGCLGCWLLPIILCEDGHTMRSFMNLCIRNWSMLQCTKDPRWFSLRSIVREVLCGWWLLCDVLGSSRSTLGRGFRSFSVTEKRIIWTDLRDWHRLIIQAIQRGHQSHLFSLVGDVVSSSDGGSWHPTAALHAHRGCILSKTCLMRCECPVYVIAFLIFTSRLGHCTLPLAISKATAPWMNRETHRDRIFQVFRCPAFDGNYHLREQGHNQDARDLS